MPPLPLLGVVLCKNHKRLDDALSCSLDLFFGNQFLPGTFLSLLPPNQLPKHSQGFELLCWVHVGHLWNAGSFEYGSCELLPC